MIIPKTKPASMIFFVFFSDKPFKISALKIDLISTIIRIMTMPVLRVIKPAAETKITISFIYLEMSKYCKMKRDDSNRSNRNELR